ncbi:MAG: M23 family metallopeptidase [Leptonema illini]|uniref:M23 family metallopeptidase n=1 Tax=Leptonema illini TaxID=183 RepID=A0A833LWC7_9LEPT|nr:MAG: M23 family metallopeptidase [Leptonema illini]
MHALELAEEGIGGPDSNCHELTEQEIKIAKRDLQLRIENSMGDLDPKSRKIFFEIFFADEIERLEAITDKRLGADKGSNNGDIGRLRLQFEQNEGQRRSAIEVLKSRMAAEDALRAANPTLGDLLFGKEKYATLETPPLVELANGARLPIPSYVNSAFGWRLLPREKKDSEGKVELDKDGKPIIEYYRDFHPAVDLRTGVLQKNALVPVQSVEKGLVEFAGDAGGYGKLVIVDHGDGVKTYYAHNSSINVEKGQMIRQGQIVSTSGNSGFSTAPHLHFELRVNGVQVDPLKYDWKNKEILK